MSFDELLESKMSDLERVFAPVIGKKLKAIETPELHDEEKDNWEDFREHSVRLYFDGEFAATLAWDKFDELCISPDTKIASCYRNTLTIRWLKNTVTGIERLIDRQLKTVELGKGSMSFGENEFDIWIRILLGFETGYFEIYNALDENGYAVHTVHPDGEFLTCT